MKFKTLTRADGKVVYVNAETVYFITPNVAGPDTAVTQLIHSGGNVYVRETPEVVKIILEEE